MDGFLVRRNGLVACFIADNGDMYKFLMYRYDCGVPLINYYDVVKGVRMLIVITSYVRRFMDVDTFHQLLQE
jgi:hypothetical protein